MQFEIILTQYWGTNNINRKRHRKVTKVKSEFSLNSGLACSGFEKPLMKLNALNFGNFLVFSLAFQRVTFQHFTSTIGTGLNGRIDRVRGAPPDKAGD